MMNSNFDKDNQTAREEAEGKEVWLKIQNKEIACADLSDKNFGSVGEYFMGQMMGSSHAAMNQMMINAMGEKGEESMHIIMGKRLSGCDTEAVFPAQGFGFMPMMNMMMGGWSPSFNNNLTNNNMMNFGFGMFGLFSWIAMLLIWAVLILAIIALLKYINKK